MWWKPQKSPNEFWLCYFCPGVLDKYQRNKESKKRTKQIRRLYAKTHLTPIQSWDSVSHYLCDLYSVFVPIVKCKYGNVLIILTALGIIISYKFNLSKFFKEALKRKTTESIDKKRVTKNQ